MSLQEQFHVEDGMYEAVKLTGIKSERLTQSNIDKASLNKVSSLSYKSAKRLIDIIASITLLLITSPLLLIVALAVKTTSKGPVIFWSQRLGSDKTAFPMPKFRSMEAGSNIVSREIATENDIKLTPIGKFIRSTSLDELPQLWCVLKGDMSLIGPRPLLLNDYAGQERSSKPVIYNVKPGITGLAQVNGRNFITPRNKIKYDVFYANNYNLYLDMKIIFKTFGTVLNTKMVQ